MAADEGTEASHQPLHLFTSSFLESRLLVNSSKLVVAHQHAVRK